ncbi:MAG TPA: transcription termination/antitermination protein NusG [Ignavibacteriaceae bacterium]|nr:transcription termination/antitermination protein NusG [Ignavibacteriaceae bacterium]
MEFKWYVVRTFSGHENKVKTLLDTEIGENEGLQAKVKEVLVPVEKVFEVKDGKKKSKTKNFFPGYILLNADLDNQVKEFILNTPSVMGFLGTRSNPNPLQPEEVKRIIGRISQDETSERSETIFRNGDIVKIIDGPFNNFSGTIQEVNEEKMKIKVMVSIFGRKTPVEIDFVQAELEK